MLVWNEQFETGHSLLDAQHRMLISYINRLEELAKSDQPSSTDVQLFMRFVDFLESYLLMHFTTEEDCMHRFKCPVHADNKRAHASFLDFFLKFKTRLRTEGCHPNEMRLLHGFCDSWIKKHILRIDVQLRPCLTQPSGPDEAWQFGAS